jgi:hypothetical protein
MHWIHYLYFCQKPLMQSNSFVFHFLSLTHSNTLDLLGRLPCIEHWSEASAERWIDFLNDWTMFWTDTTVLWTDKKKLSYCCSHSDIQYSGHSSFFEHIFCPPMILGWDARPDAASTATFDPLTAKQKLLRKRRARMITYDNRSKSIVTRYRPRSG